MAGLTQEEHNMFKKVLVPVDLNEPAFSEKAMALALREMDDQDSELHLIAIVPGFTNSYVASYFSESTHKKAVKELAQKLKEYANSHVPESVKSVLKVYEGSPAEQIVAYIKKQKIDLVIMSAHHRNPVDEFLLGSVSARVAERSRCSVLLIKN